MIAITKTPDTHEKLALLSRDARYDLACACGTREDEHRRRSQQNTWIYPVSLPAGGTTYLFKTLLSNACLHDCRYCPLRRDAETRRCSLTPEELARTFLSYHGRGRVSGLFLSSAVSVSPDATMERINRTALILRRSRFKGYLHLKVIPGASEAAIRQSLSLANAVSLNIETAGPDNFRRLSSSKDYQRDILDPIRLISRLTARGGLYAGVKQTTQFVVGAGTETDGQIIGYSWKLYRELGLARVYFSAYQRQAGASPAAGKEGRALNGALLTREHRLYQTDWLIRKYGFRADEIPLDASGNLSLDKDPKEAWAQAHPEFFPVHVNRDDARRLARVPGLGLTSVQRILDLRRAGLRIHRLEQLGRTGKALSKITPYVAF
ncbi:MAG: radical SAM protein [Deltaproteobacteria bacterium]